MKRKSITIILIILLLLPLLTVTAFAADLTNEDVVDAQGGFFRDLIRSIINGFNNSIDNAKNGFSSVLLGLKNSVDAIGLFFSKVITAIGRAISDLLDGLKQLFIPRSDYFPRVLERLQLTISKKFGGIQSFSSYLQDRFSKLRSNPDAGNMLTVDFPNGHMYGGAQIDFMTQIRPYISIFRDVFSALMILATGIFLYRHVNKMVDT